MPHRLAIILVTAIACGPTVDVDASGGGSDESPSASDSDSSSHTDSPSSAVCGDGIVDETEACDDANPDGLDGCDAHCRIAGTQLWEVNVPSSSCPRLEALASNNVAVVGNEYAAPEAAFPHVMVLDTDGNVPWSALASHWQYDEARDVVADASGFVVVGHGDGPTGFVDWMQRWSVDGSLGADVLFEAGEVGGQILDIERRDATSYWTIAIDYTGGPELLYFRGFDQAPSAGISLIDDSSDMQLARAPDEGVYVTADGYVGTLTRLDREGSMLWSLEYESAGDGSAFTYALASTAAGDVVVAGTDPGDSDADAQWLRRFDRDGLELWRVPVEVSATPSRDRPLHVAVRDDDAVFVAGETELAEGYEGFVAKYDSTGEELWQAVWPMNGVESVRTCDIAVTSDGLVLVAVTVEVPDAPVQPYWVRAVAG